MLINHINQISNFEIMKTKRKKNKQIREYVKPEIEIIKIDNEISLSLDSNPPIGPDEKLFISGSHTDPYKEGMV